MKKVARSLFKSLLWGTFFLIAFVLLINSFFYIWTPIYDFKSSTPFSGSFWYNPYQETNSLGWEKANFHAHSKAWLGLTDGSNSDINELFKIYKEMGFLYASVSNYQKITNISENSNYIPSYEHGYNILKTHQLCIGAKSVCWWDYLFGSTLNGKQYMIDKLKESCAIVVLAHPSFRKAYSTDDAKFLSSYDCIEVVNGYRISESHWDSALSAGKYIPLIANDDAHDLSQISETGRRFTVLYNPSGRREEALESLKKGKSFAVDISKDSLQKKDNKLNIHHRIPTVIKFHIENDSLKIAFDTIVGKLFFISQHSQILDSIENIRTLDYSLKNITSYLRVKAIFKNGITIWLNPVVKVKEDGFPIISKNEVSLVSTWFVRIIGLLVLIVTFYLIFIFLLKRRKRFKSN